MFTIEIDVSTPIQKTEVESDDDLHITMEIISHFIGNLSVHYNFCVKKVCVAVSFVWKRSTEFAAQKGKVQYNKIFKRSKVASMTSLSTHIMCGRKNV